MKALESLAVEKGLSMRLILGGTDVIGVVVRLVGTPGMQHLEFVIPKGLALRGVALDGSHQPTTRLQSVALRSELVTLQLPSIQL